MVVLLVAALVVVGVAAGVAVRWWTWQPLIQRRVMVQLDTGVTLEGVVMSRRGPLLVLANVTVHTPGPDGGVHTPADGTSVVERQRVVWVQVVT